ncbi:hypothetical protein GGI15_002619 [Coemansia interrupta]|uniref:Uncharacterized protein n=1 Tax=Coemansia interrupta TaxID=1126814 RepID=A0A9W8LL35_9FUNG|nr:hypothetical protein GGI15_002619 [Coemansia interrupta]
MTQDTGSALPFDVLVAVCAVFPRCACDGADTGADGGAAALGCTGRHAPGAFVGGTALSALRQTSRAWRAAALRHGCAQVVGSGQWARGAAGRLGRVRAAYGAHVRRLVFRAGDVFRAGERDGAAMLAMLEAFLALDWPRVDSVAIEWFSGAADDHRRIAAAVRRHAGRARDVLVRDKGARLASVGALLWEAGGGLRLRRLAIAPYGYNERWADLRSDGGGDGGGAAAAVARVPGRLEALGVGGRDFSAALLAALQHAQPQLAALHVSHAWLEALAAPARLAGVRRLQLEHVVADGSLPLRAAMFPRLQALSVRHVWQPTARASVRGAESMQSARWLDAFCAQPWPLLRVLALPAVADADAERLPRACPALVRLTTHSLDYAGPPLTAAGLAQLLRMPWLRHLTVEQRRADGSPGYAVLDTALVRLLAADDAECEPLALRRVSSTETAVSSAVPSDDEADAPCRGGGSSDTEVEAEAEPDSFALSRRGSPILHSQLTALVVPCASFSPASLDALLRRLPGLVRLSVSLRGEFDAGAAFFGGAKLQPPRLASLRSIALTADDAVLTDAPWLAAWLARRFPQLRECRTNHSRLHRRLEAGLRAVLPGVDFGRLSSRVLQATSD